MICCSLSPFLNCFSAVVSYIIHTQRFSGSPTVCRRTSHQCVCVCVCGLRRGVGVGDRDGGWGLLLQPRAAAGDKEAAGPALKSGIFPPSLLSFHFPTLKRRHDEAVASGCSLRSASLLPSLHPSHTLTLSPSCSARAAHKKMTSQKISWFLYEKKNISNKSYKRWRRKKKFIGRQAGVEAPQWKPGQHCSNKRSLMFHTFFKSCSDKKKKWRTKEHSDSSPKRWPAI